jgi:hypothetical protein
MRRTAILFTLLFALAMAANAQGIAVGAAMENFSLPDITGKMQTLDGLKGKNGSVVRFSFCPMPGRQSL